MDGDERSANNGRPADNATGQDSGQASPETTVRITYVQVPLRALLAKLPNELRGDAWQGNAIPDGTLNLIAPDLLRRLGTGRVVYPLEDVFGDVPSGWIRPQPNALVELDLAGVVSALPPELLQLKAELPEDVRAASDMPDYFVPAAVNEQAAEPATVLPGTREPQPRREPEPEAERVLEEALVHGLPLQTPAAGAGVIAVPVKALLSKLPEPLRGEAWNSEQFPNTTIDVPAGALIEQLRTGRIALSLADVIRDLPAGWVQEVAGAEVELDLAEVVSAVPPQLLRTQAETPDDLIAAEKMPDYFVPATIQAGSEAVEPPAETGELAPEPLPVETEPAPETATAQADHAEPEPAPVPRPPRPGWSGLTPSIELAPRGVDLNSSSAAALASLRGIGEVRAKAIVESRERDGRFRSVFDVVRIPGIGPGLFRKMTGISVRTHNDPHTSLLSMLADDQADRPLFARLADAMTQELSLTGCVLTNHDGLALGTSGVLADNAEHYAALGAHVFFRTARMLQRFVGQNVDTILVPGGDPPLVLMRAGEAVAILALSSQMPSVRKLARASAIVKEIGWLLGPRAVVMDV